MNNIIMNKLIVKEDLVLNNITNEIIDIDDGVTLKIDLNKSSINKCEFNLGNNSYLIINKKYNEEEISESITINLNGISSRVDYNFRTLVYNNQKYLINVNHNNKNTISNIINRGVVKNDSSLVFEVNSKVDKGNINSVLNQESKIIIMSKNNSIIKPNLYIDEYNVDARHAASIGKFRKEDIFYLMTKGINEEDSVKLLIDGFLK